MNARNGKIARLPGWIRDQLNEHLDQGQDGPEILDWLNPLPEVQAVLQKHFAGLPISKQNLSEWRQGGFQEWLLRRDLLGEAREVADLADEMDGQSADGELVDGVATVLAARFGGLIARWNGEVDEKVEAKARFLNGICRSVVRLQRSTHRSNRDRLEEQRLIKEQEDQEKEGMRRKLMRPFLNYFQSRSLARRLGGGEVGARLAECIVDALTDDFDGPPAAPKATPEWTNKPLEPNNMENSEESQSSFPESESVKVSQTLRQ